MVVESVKKVKNIVSEVFKGYASNSSGGCCGVSLPPEEQRQVSDVVRFYFATRGVYHAVSIEWKENELSL